MSVGAATTIDPAKTLDQAIAALNAPDAALPLEDVDRALKLAPNDARLWHIKGLMHREQERRELAIPALRRAVELAPQEPLIAHGYARTLWEAGLPSVEAFGRALRLAPQSEQVVQGLVTALLVERRFEDAIAGLESVLVRNPLWAGGHTLLAKIRWTEGDREDFTRSFDETLARHPAAMDLWREQIISLIYAEQWDEVLDRIERGRKAVGDQPVFAINEAVVQAELGNTQRADELFAPFADLDDSTVQLRRVRHLLRSGRPEEAAPVVESEL